MSKEYFVQSFFEFDFILIYQLKERKVFVLFLSSKNLDLVWFLLIVFKS